MSYAINASTTIAPLPLPSGQGEPPSTPHVARRMLHVSEDETGHPYQTPGTSRSGPGRSDSVFIHSK